MRTLIRSVLVAILLGTVTAATAQLPPEIMLDGHLLRAEAAVRQRDPAAARAAMDRIAALQEQHELVTPPTYHYRYASVWNALSAWDQSLASAVRYLELTGRDGEHYLDALTLMNRATAAIEELQRARELRAAEEARARAAEAAARAEAERALNAARDLLTQMEFVPISPGRFRMGSNDRFPGRVSGRYGRTQVRLTRPYEIARYELTQSQYVAAMGALPFQLRGPCERCPIMLTLAEVTRFLILLNAAADSNGDWSYRLPTEAEWEYAARAGAEGDRFIRARDLEEYAWFGDNSKAPGGDRHVVHPIGLKRPNGLGLYDTFGNAAEWTLDWYGPYPGGTVTDPTGHPTGVYRYNRGRDITQPSKVTRGCDYFSTRIDCERQDRSLYELRPDLPDDRGDRVGVRLVRVAR